MKTRHVAPLTLLSTFTHLYSTIPSMKTSLAANLRSLALELTRASKSDILDHARVLADTAKEIRRLLKQTDPARVIIRVKGGLVTDVYASDPQSSVAVLDEDLLDEGDPTLDEDRMQEARDLEVEIESLTEVR